jgi:serine/threonine protein kinase
MLQVAGTMRYMHSQKIVHHDLKPAHILVEAVNDAEFRMEGFVVAKLTEFGLAHQGTRRWMAPEVFGADADNKLKLVGCIFFQNRRVQFWHCLF